jgi:hypothetical protein
MNKAKKRTAKSSSKRAGARGSTRGSTTQNKVAKTKKRSGAITRSKVKGTAKKRRQQPSRQGWQQSILFSGSLALAKRSRAKMRRKATEAAVRLQAC